MSMLNSKEEHSYSSLSLLIITGPVFQSTHAQMSGRIEYVATTVPSLCMSSVLYLHPDHHALREDEGCTR